MYWKDNTVTLEWKDFKDDKHGDINNLTNTVLDLMPPIDKDANIVELGCGQGRNIKALKDLGYTNVIGVEINSENIEQSLIDYPEDNILIVKDDVSQFLKDMQEVDLIITASAAYLMPPTRGQD